MVRCGNIQEYCFQIGDQRLTIDANDIHLVKGLSCHGTDISLFVGRQSGEPTKSYLAQHCAPKSKPSSGRINIK